MSIRTQLIFDPFSMFNGVLSPSIKFLNLQSCNLYEMPILKCFPNLEYLNINNNFLSNLKFLQNCEQLREIYISNNKIKHLINLSKKENLQILDLSFNQIENFETIAMLCMNQNLKSLNLKANPISIRKNYKENIFSLLFSLKTLDENVKKN